ncbi:hypothetical protein J2Z65_004538 [Paenibacillus aceris]|uniref:Uncharacterized protein n=1 Tax=Paenibacillus aceris TaxID=869555 RepID=A0ABS4I4G8_9BACL|nr:hypothetical protein [Paenibacillus aceris]
MIASNCNNPFILKGLFLCAPTFINNGQANGVGSQV